MKVIVMEGGVIQSCHTINGADYPSLVLLDYDEKGKGSVDIDGNRAMVTVLETTPMDKRVKRDVLAALGAKM
jgi:hypothetical protein